ITAGQHSHGVIAQAARFEGFLQSFLLKLHGSHDLPKSLVITEGDLTDFEDSRKEILYELSRLLNSQSVLVVGSSMRDPSVLRLFRSRKSSLPAYCLIPINDPIATARLDALELHPIVASIESFFLTLEQSLASTTL